MSRAAFRSSRCVRSRPRVPGADVRAGSRVYWSLQAAPSPGAGDVIVGEDALHDDAVPGVPGAGALRNATDAARVCRLSTSTYARRVVDWRRGRTPDAADSRRAVALDAVSWPIHAARFHRRDLRCGHPLLPPQLERIVRLFKLSPRRRVQRPRAPVSQSGLALQLEPPQPLVRRADGRSRPPPQPRRLAPSLTQSPVDERPRPAGRSGHKGECSSVPLSAVGAALDKLQSVTRRTG